MNKPLKISQVIKQPKLVPLRTERMVKVTVDETTAEKWLAKNMNFRDLRPVYAQSIGCDIIENGWRQDGNTVKVDDQDRLVDGQHRLEGIRLACSAGHPPVEVWFCFGVTDTTTVDTGRRRTVQDHLRFVHEKNVNNLAAALSGIWRIETESIYNSTKSPTVNQTLAVLAKHPDVRGSVISAMKIKRISRTGMIPALHCLCPDKKVGDLFIDGLATGTNLDAGSPIRLFRERMVRNKTSKAKLTVIETYAILFKAWNYHVAGRQMNILRWTAGYEDPPVPVFDANVDIR